MRATYDPQVDMAYIYVQDNIPPGGVAKTIEVRNDKDHTLFVIDLDAEGKLLGIEVFSKKYLPKEVMDTAEILKEDENQKGADVVFIGNFPIVNAVMNHLKQFPDENK